MSSASGDAGSSVLLSWLQLGVSVLAIIAPVWFGLWTYRRDHPSTSSAAPTRRQSPPTRSVPVWAWAIGSIIVVGFIGIGGMIFFFNRSPVIHPDAAVVTPRPTTSSSAARPNAALVQNIYNVLAARGRQDLQTQGFSHVREEDVCSNSVAAGRIRQVILDNGKALGQEDEIVGESGVSGTAVALSTPLIVKVSTGPCG